MRLILMILIGVMVGGVAYGEINLEAIAKVESSNNPKAIGDHGKAIGLYQLHKGAVEDVNRRLKANYSHKDALEPKKARIIADCYLNRVIPSYLKHYGVNDTTENRLTAYNMGIVAVIKGKKATKYIKKYQEAL